MWIAIWTDFHTTSRLAKKEKKRGKPELLMHFDLANQLVNEILKDSS